MTVHHNYTYEIIDLRVVVQRFFYPAGLLAQLGDLEIIDLTIGSQSAVVKAGFLAQVGYMLTVEVRKNNDSLARKY